MNNLEKWTEVRREFPHRNIPKSIADANSRFKLAKSDLSVRFSGYSQATQEGYALLFKVAIAYSALEAVESAFKANDNHVPRTLIRQYSLSQLFRSAPMRDFLKSLEQSIDRIGTMRAFEEFVECKSDNLRVLAQVLRNSVFHSRVSPGGLRLSAKFRRDALESLALIVLEAADRRFSELFDSAVLHRNGVSICSTNPG
jgi:hypothetical protein